jgi:hypothetical protein
VNSILGKDLEGSSYSLFEILSLHFHGGTEENHGIPESV